ncbi:hypothetical protein K2173_004120 [Erythroxylum novogranatense]|uniref:Cytochrome P450 n=1 Tax=Erythroxylum novogranatense TaxID=1862640 RepID=A0AAV8SYN8_9ROSI|nr:hypothetical protein K2173_004120 [Erythroxylum novogranatense]
MELVLVFLVLKTLAFIALMGFLSLVLQMCDSLILKPERLRSKLRKQGIRGPPPRFLLGNIAEMRKAKSKFSNSSKQEEQIITHNCSSTLFPFFDGWRKEYGSTFMFSLGNIPILHTNNPEVVRETSKCTSLNLGKPSYQQKERGALLGRGILTSNGTEWAHQRRILAPELYPEKVKNMIPSMVESSMLVIKSWADKLESEGGISEIKIDECMRSFSGDVISRACFGSNYSKGGEIFHKLRALEEAMSRKVMSNGIPILRYLPTKSNREIWRLERELRDLIMSTVNDRTEPTSENDILHKIISGASSSNVRKDCINRFIVDNCKNIYLAGYETTAIAATWTLMLLASNPEWQEKVRVEVLQVCGGQKPDSNTLLKMKTLTMVIQESLRLYPPVTVMSREALQDMRFGNISVPKGVNIWTLNVTMHQDPEIWGPDAHEFNPERFVNGVKAACRFPHLFMPFGMGPRTCLGQHFAVAELKVLISSLVSNFSFVLSPKYVHCPDLRLVTEPKYGVDLLVRRL